MPSQFNPSIPIHMKPCTICLTPFLPTDDSAETRQCCRECVDTFVNYVFAPPESKNA